MKRWGVFGLGTLAVAGGASVLGLGTYRSAMAEAQGAYERLAGGQSPPPAPRFDSDMIARLPEIARRYFRHAIAPGPPLFSSVEL
jgi:hypothetical protein